MIQKGATRRCQFDTASSSLQKFGTYLVLEISNLPAQRRLRRVQKLLLLPRSGFRYRRLRRNNEDVVIPLPTPMLVKHRP